MNDQKALTTPQEAEQFALAPKRFSQPIESYQEAKVLGEIFEASGFFPDLKNKAQAVVKILTGAELGLTPMQAMMNIYVIPGGSNKPPGIRLSAKLLGALLKQHPRYDYAIDSSSLEQCRITFYEYRPNLNNPIFKEKELLGTNVYTMQDAKKAGLVNKDNWSKYPKLMLFYRCLSQGISQYCPEVTCGLQVETRDVIEGSFEDNVSIAPPRESAQPLPQVSASDLYPGEPETIEDGGINDDQLKKIHAIYGEKKLQGYWFRDTLQDRLNLADRHPEKEVTHKSMTKEEASAWIQYLDALPKVPDKPKCGDALAKEIADRLVAFGVDRKDESFYLAFLKYIENDETPEINCLTKKRAESVIEYLDDLKKLFDTISDYIKNADTTGAYIRAWYKQNTDADSFLTIGRASAKQWLEDLESYVGDDEAFAQHLELILQTAEEMAVSA